MRISLFYPISFSVQIIPSTKELLKIGSKSARLFETWCTVVVAISTLFQYIYNILEVLAKEPEREFGGDN